MREKILVAMSGGVDSAVSALMLKGLNEVIDFEYFRDFLKDAVIPKERLSNASARRYDPVLMFKIMVLQRVYSLSDGEV